MSLPRRAGRKRSASAHRAILAASLALSRRDGYCALTVDAIAAAAGVGKQTIYRWWPSKAEVVLEALAERSRLKIKAPGVGTLADEVAAFMSLTFKSLSGRGGTGPIFKALMAEAQWSPAFAERFRAALIDHRRAALAEVFERHGIPPARHPLLLDLGFGPVWYRLLLEYGPLDDAYARQIAESVALAAASGL